MVRLLDGRVLIAGGCCGGTNVVRRSTEIWDSQGDIWAPSGDLNDERFGMSAVLLTDGRVLIGGGLKTGIPVTGYSNGEIFDPASGSWTKTTETAVIYGDNRIRSSTDFRPVPFAGVGQTLVLLANGRVLSVGAVRENGLAPEKNAEVIYDPASDTWALTTPILFERENPEAVRLPNGRVLVAGGDFLPITARLDSEVFNPAAGTWTGAGDIPYPGEFPKATLLANGSVLLTGGSATTFNSKLKKPTLPNAAIFVP
jgi:hypothetical protein